MHLPICLYGHFNSFLFSCFLHQQLAVYMIYYGCLFSTGSWCRTCWRVRPTMCVTWETWLRTTLMLLMRSFQIETKEKTSSEMWNLSTNSIICMSDPFYFEENFHWSMHVLLLNITVLKIKNKSVLILWLAPQINEIVWRAFIPLHIHVTWFKNAY